MTEDTPEEKQPQELETPKAEAPEVEVDIEGLKKALEEVSGRQPDKQLVFVKSWNEWAEGNYMEPDQRFGKSYLQVVKDQIFSFSNR